MEKRHAEFFDKLRALLAEYSVEIEISEEGYFGQTYGTYVDFVFRTTYDSVENCLSHRAEYRTRDQIIDKDIEV